MGDPWAGDSWLAVRDPSGDLRRQLETISDELPAVPAVGDIAAAAAER